jgi:hypothetical protein
MPGIATAKALDRMEDPDDGRVHLVRPESIRPIGNGLFEAITVCGKRIVGVPSDEPPPHATCEHCIAAARPGG